MRAAQKKLGTLNTRAASPPLTHSPPPPPNQNQSYEDAGHFCEYAFPDLLAALEPRLRALLAAAE